jgi:hypothetical protein
VQPLDFGIQVKWCNSRSTRVVMIDTDSRLSITASAAASASGVGRGHRQHSRPGGFACRYACGGVFDDERLSRRSP